MSAHLISIAEKLRAAGRLLSEVEELTRPGSVVDENAQAVRGSITDIGRCIDALWGHFGCLVGPEYLDWAEHGKRMAAVSVTGEISHAVLKVSRAEWEEASALSDFAYRDVARKCLEILDTLEGRKGGEGR